MENDSVDISQLTKVALMFGNNVQGTGISRHAASNVYDAKAPRSERYQIEDNHLDEVPKGGIPRVDKSQAGHNVTVPDVSKEPRMSGGSDPSGDTQPLSQWVYDEHTMRTKGLERVVENSTRDTGTHPTLHTGQKGYIDLVRALDGPDLSDGEASDGAPEDGIMEVSQVEVRAEIFPEHRRFQVPKTPATNGKKRNYQGEVLKSGGTTPSLPVNPFGCVASDNAGAMELSQVFRATQAGTSPAANLLFSDVPSTRPSPAFNQEYRPSTTGSLSSPAILRHTGIQRATTEPHSKYVSMQESQAERRKRQQGLSTSSPIDKRKCDWGFSDDELDPIEQKAQNREKQRRREAEAKKQFAGMIDAIASKTNSASRRSKLLEQREPSSPTVRKANGASLQKPLAKETIDLTTGNLTEDETEHEEDPEELDDGLSDDLDELVEDDKENVGRRQARVVTPKSKGGGPRTIIAYSSPELRQQAPSSPVAQEEVDELDANDFPHPLSQPRLPMAIADSQSSQKLPAHKRRRLSENDQPQARISSPTSRTVIPQSQAVLHTSQLDSSMKRHLSEPSPLFIARKPLQNHSSPNSECSSTQHYNKTSQVKMEPAHPKDPPAYGSSPPVPMGAPALPVPSRNVDNKKQNQDPGEDLRPVQEHTLSPSNGTTGINSKHTTNTTSAGSSTTHHATLRSTIPETSSVVRHTATHPIDSYQNTNNNNDNIVKALQSPTPLRQSNSKGSTNFETAQSHVAKSPNKALAQATTQGSKDSRSPASPSFAGIRKFTDIAADPSPLNDEGDMDVDINLMTGEDVEFQSLMDGSSPVGPAAKRRRRTYGRRVGSDVRDRVMASSEVASSPAVGGRDIVDGNAKTIVLLSEQGPTDSKGNRSGTRQEEGNDDNENRLESTNSIQRETEQVMTQIHHPPPPSEVGKAPVGSKADNEIGGSRAPVNCGPTSHEGNRPKVDTIASRRLKRKSQDLASDRDVDELAQQEEQTIPRGRPPKPTPITHRDLSPSITTNLTTNLTKMLAPTRVLAHFNAICPGFYPATCLYLLSGEPTRLKVRFDDGATAELHPSHVKRLDLRPGDFVKLDQPNQRAQTFVVQSLQGQEALANPMTNPITPSKRKSLLANCPNKFPKTDIFGNTTVTISLKQNSAKSTSEVASRTQTVPLESIYLSQSLFKKLKDRTYMHPTTTYATALQTPSDLSSMPSTPPSRARRNRASHSSFDIPPSASKTTHPSSGLFGNMVFSMTNVSEKTRSSLVKSISANGGILLESPQGFCELFVDDTSSTLGDFALTPRAQSKGFTALLAGDHCRRAKYIQALALGIPCLSTRWVDDCISANELLAWEPYLLASGESSFLHSAIRSRLLPSYPPETATLQAIIASRPRFLQDRAILLIIGKGNSADIMKNYPFIARALGARKVERVISAEEGRERLREEKFDWVYYYEGDKGDKASAESVEAVLFGKSKKRKRGSARDDEVRKGDTRTVTTEFVVQSLILGTLVPGK